MTLFQFIGCLKLHLQNDYNTFKIHKLATTNLRKMKSLILTGLIFSFLLSGCSTDSASTQEQEMQQLEKMYDEILLLSVTQECNNSADWDYTAIGSKACGGPIGYIAYSLKINTTTFLEKVKNYTNAQKEFNDKWNISSTCEVPPAPISIKCENGKAVLIY